MRAGVLMILLSFSAQASAQPMHLSAWPMQGRTPMRSGRSLVAAPPNHILTGLWKADEGEPLSPPVIGADGTTYIGSTDNNLYAVHPDGTLYWKYTTCSDIISSPAIAEDGTIYVGSMDKFLHAVTATGTLKWKHRVDSGICSSPVIDADGTVFVATQKGLHAITATGEAKWKPFGDVSSAPTAAPTSAPTPAPTHNHHRNHWHHNHHRHHRHHNHHNHHRHFWGRRRLLSTDSCGTIPPNSDHGICSSPALGRSHDKTVYVGSIDNLLYAVSTDTGELKWKFPPKECEEAISECDMGSQANSTLVDACEYDPCDRRHTGMHYWHSTTGILSTPAVGADGTVYFGSNDRRLYALKPTGALKWTPFVTDGSIVSSPAIGSDQIVYAASEDKHVYALAGGKMKWKWPLSDCTGEGRLAEVQSSPVLGSDGTVYIGLGETLCAVTPEGKLQWKYQMGADFDRAMPTVPTTRSPTFNSTFVPKLEPSGLGLPCH